MMASQQLNGNGKLSSIEVAIVNYLKLQKFDRNINPPEIELLSDDEVAAKVGIKGGATAARELLQNLADRGIVKSDRYANWGLIDRFEQIVQVKGKNEAKEKELSNSISKNITLIKRDNKLFAKVSQLTRHPLNEQIYGLRNFEKLLAKIKQEGWIKTLIIKADGTIISGHSRHQCAVELGIEEVRVEIVEFEHEWQEIKMLLLENDYRHKTPEEKGREAMWWEKIEKEEAKLRQAAAAIATNKKLDNVAIDVNTLSPNLGQACGSNNQKGRAIELAASQVGLKKSNYSKIKKVIKSIDALREQGRSGAADGLSQLLNQKSTNAADLQLKELTKIEKAIAALKEKNQDDAAEELEGRLKWHSIKDATELMKEWQNAYIDRSNRLPEGTVVRIKTKLCRNQWAIVEREDNNEFTCNLMIHQGELKEAHKSELETIELTPEQKEEALKLMLRMQLLWGQLDELGEEQPAREFLKGISVKKLPALSRLERAILTNLEKETTVILTEKVIDRRKKEAES